MENENITIILDTAEKKHISEWEVLTPDGFKDFSGIRKIIKDEYYILYIDGNEFICSANHKIKTKDGFKYAKDLKYGEELLEGQTVDSIMKVDEKIDLYDLLNVGEEHEYYTNGIISSNCAFAEYAREIWTAAQQAAMEGKIIIISTPCVIGNTKIKVKNKDTQEIREINIQDLLEDEYGSNWEVLTPNGWSNFSRVKCVQKESTIKITLSDNSILEGDSAHKIKLENGNFIELEKLKIGTKLSNDLEVKNIETNFNKVNLYDILDVELNSEYYTNNAISHNCGVGGFYHQMWTEAEAGLNDFNTIKLKWDVHPDHDQAWRDEQTTLLGERLAAQECLDGDCTVTVKDIRTKTIQIMKLKDLDENINTKYEILTPSGFVKFAGINRLLKDEYIYLAFSNDTELKCSINHTFIRDGNQIKSEELNIGDYVDGKNGIITIIDKKIVRDPIDLYDIVEVGDGNIFYVNDGIVSHNCDADFITSGHTVIDGEILQWYKDNIEDPIEKRGLDGNIWIWERPDYHKSYVVCADVARGDGEDYSAFHILDIEDVRQVAEYKGKIPPAEFGNMLISMATEYNDALLIVDNTGLGWAAIQPAIDRHYPYLFYMSKDFAYMDIQVQLQKGLDLKQKEDMVPGFTISTKTRPVIISKLETYFRERTPVIRSTRIVDELFVFVWNNGKAEARRGYNDDLVMALSIGFWVRDTALQLNQKGLALTKASMDYIGKLNEPQIYSTSPYTEAGKKAWSMNVGRNQTEDISWLVR